MARNKQIRIRARWGVLGLLTMAALVIAAAVASGAELITAEVDAAPPNDVTVTQGTSTDFNIAVFAAGKMDSSITASNPSTAAVKTKYSLDSSGSLASDTFSSSMNFYSSGMNCSGGNCDVKWDSPTPYSVGAKVTAAATTPVGNYTVTLSVAAGTTQIVNPSATGGKLSDTTATTVTVHVVAPVVTNHPPTVATPADDATGNEGAALSTNGAFQDQDGNPLTITKTSGAGTVTGSGSGAWSWSYTPDDNSDGTVVVEADDGHGGSVTDTFTWSAANVAPTAAITGAPNSSSPEGTAISLASTVTDPSSADTAAGFTKSWTVTKDGNAYGEGSGSSFSFTPDDNGTYLVSLSATDKDGGTGQDNATITVSNVAPTVGALTLGGSSGTACIGGNTVTLDFGFSDPGANDNPWAVDINWGDGNHTTYSASSQGAQPQRSHSYPAGSYTISVSVTDKDNGTGSKTSATNAVSHTYNLSSILQPINSDGSSVFKSGSTIPVKVQILDCNSQPVPGLSPQIGTQLKSTSDPSLAIDEVSSTSAADSGTTMRYDSTAGQYIYNLASKSLSDQSATYYVYVRESHSVGKTPTGAASPGQSYQQFGLKLK